MMMHFDMMPQAAAQCIILATNSTDIRTFSRMNAHVTFQSTRGFEGFSTCWAGIRFCFWMYMLNVQFEVSCLRKWFLANVASIQLLSCMCQCVSPQITSLWECFITQSTLMWLLCTVCEHMTLQMASLWECFLAQSTFMWTQFKFMWSLSMML